MTEEAFKVGDVVRVKGQGASPSMTVSEIMPGGAVRCVYWSAMGPDGWRRLEIHVGCLEPAQ